jgi:hypothetical protein
MKKLFMCLALCAGFLMLDSTGARAQAVTSPSANAGTTVVSDLTISKTSDRQFGTIVAGATRTYRVNTDGTTTGSTAGSMITSTRSAAGFTATGQNNAQVTWTFPASISVTSGANTLSITPVLLAGATGSTLNATLSRTRTHSVAMHGTITSGGAAPATGAYTGTFTVQAAYQ